jgi:hypothetical protein
MEPANMTPPDDSEFDDLLRRGLAQPALPDGGFTGRVVRALARRSEVAHFRMWLRLAWLGAGTGFLVVVWAGSSWFGLELTEPRNAWPIPGLLANAWIYLAFAAALISCLTAWNATAASRESLARD